MRNYLLLIVFVVCSCESRPAENVDDKGSYSNEDFQSFMKRFKEDTTFQKSRTKFPIVTKYLNSNNEIIYKTNTIDDWEILNYYVPDHLKANYSHEYLPKGDTMVHVIKEIGYRLNCNYFFAVEKQKWYLVGIEDKTKP